jgi:hypothetical protein
VKKQIYLLATYGVFLLPGITLASGMTPYCKFSTSDSGSIINASYRIYEAYKAADLVVIGTAIESPQNGKAQIFEASAVVKGIFMHRVQLVGPRCQGTACDGFSVPANKRFLMLLRQVPDDVFHKVDGNGNDVCPNVFEVVDSFAKIGAQKIPIKSLQNFFESHPAPIPYE